MSSEPTTNKGGTPSSTPTKASTGGGGGGANPSTPPPSILQLSKWLSVVRYVSGLVKDVSVGRRAFEARAKVDQRDSVSKLFAMVWPDGSNAGGKGELFALFALGLLRVGVLAESANVTRSLATVVQSGDRQGFQQVAVRTLAVAVAGALASSASAWAEQSLAIGWRERITSAIHAKYFECMNFYTIGNLAGRAAIVDPEERLSREVFSATKRLARIIALLARGLPSLAFFTARLWRAKGAKSALLPLLYYGLAYEVAQRLFPKNIGELYRAQAGAVGAFFRSATRAQTHGEAIAAMGGAPVEKQGVLGKFQAVAGAAQGLFAANSRFSFIFKTAYIYVPRVFLSAMVYWPVLQSPASSSAAAELGSFRETAQVLLEMLVANGDILTMYSQAEHMQGTAYRITSLYETLCKLTATFGQRQTATFTTGSDISFTNVQVTTPTNIKLVKDLSFSVPAKTGKLLLTGQNGAGKSSIFRCLGGLWESQGSIVKPEAREIFYLPQKPYNVLGTLMEQLTYPFDASLSDEEMRALLESVDLLHLLTGDVKNSVVNWEERLSLGESQRLAMARLFFHKPKFAIIDEATSACSKAMEDALYRRCEELGIAYITICHRPALKRYHDVNLNLTGDGNGGWELKTIDHADDEESEPAAASSTKFTASDPGKSMHNLVYQKPQTAPEQWVAARSGPYAHMRNKLAIPRRSVWGNLKKLLSIVLPGSFSRMGLLLGAIGLRTGAHEIFGRVSGALLAATLARDKDAFRKAVAAHFAVDVATSFIDESVTWLQNEMGVHWSQNLSKHGIDLFFRDNAFYNASAVDRRIKDPDQRVTQEVAELAQAMAGLFASSLTPLLDCTYFGWRIYSSVGLQGVTPLGLYAAAATSLLTMAMPNHQFYNRKEKELESQYRFVQTRLKVHAESIAFLGGGQRERQIADEKLARVIQHAHKKNNANALFKSVLYSIYEDVDSYSGIVTAPDVVLSWMQLLGATQTKQQGSTSLAQSNVYLASATDKLLSSAGKLANLAESVASTVSGASRVVELFDVLEEMHRSGLYSEERMQGAPDCKAIEMHHCDLVTPDGVCLAADLNVVVPASNSLMVTGVNSSGKTALFRVLSNLWPAHGAQASIVRPPRSKFMLVPQKPYSFDGTLAQQVAYPNVALAATEGDAIKVALEYAGIGYLVQRFEKGLAQVQRWEDTLSLGEQQRLGFARLFFHKPLFAVCDECSDAVSMEQEAKLYRKLHELGITVITISKRMVLAEFHQQHLSFGVPSAAGWLLEPLSK